MFTFYTWQQHTTCACMVTSNTEHSVGSVHIHDNTAGYMYEAVMVKGILSVAH